MSTIWYFKLARFCEKIPSRTVSHLWACCCSGTGAWGRSTAPALEGYHWSGGYPGGSASGAPSGYLAPAPHHLPRDLVWIFVFAFCFALSLLADNDEVGVLTAARDDDDDDDNRKIITQIEPSHSLAVPFEYMLEAVYPYVLQVTLSAAYPSSCSHEDLGSASWTAARSTWVSNLRSRQQDKQANPGEKWEKNVGIRT